MARIGLPQIASRPASHRLPWQTSGGESQSITRSYFGADNKLRFQQVYLVPTNSAGFFDPPPPQKGSWEEHWYDALGRKVLTRARRDTLCTPTPNDPCSSYIERTVWDGDQLLYELRGLGGNSATLTQLEADVASGYAYGKVGCVHAGGIDAPLVLMDGRVPNYNWRGLPESSVWLAGTSADCAIPTGTTCTTIQWPGNQGVYMKPGGPGTSTSGNTPQWVGSLMANGVGSTGMAYRRNRFYDGATGQFNQQDPIGLAGGANSYGFAGGDPVSYSDPYGLMRCPPFCFGGGGDFGGGGGGADWGDAPAAGGGSSRAAAPNGVEQSALAAALLEGRSASSNGITDRNIRIGTGSATQYIRFGKAPDQVEPGIGNIKGVYTPEKRMQPEPYSAHYDPFGRQIARTDYTDQPDPKTHTNPHHHIRTYRPGCGAKGCESGPLPGPYKLDQ